MSFLFTRLSALIKRAGHDRLTPFHVFELFREVLINNNLAFEIIADMGEKLSGDFIFDESYIIRSINQLKEAVLRSVVAINTLDPGYNELFQIYDRLTSHLLAIINGEDEFQGPTIIGLKDISSDCYGVTGGKCAHLAAMIRHMNANIPDGFCLTSNAYHQLLKSNQLTEQVSDFELESLPNSAPDLEEKRQEITETILKAEPPPTCMEQLSTYLDTLRAGSPGPLKIAVRSSAREEDMDYSFAGLYHTELCVPPDPESVFQAYLKVVASLFSKRALEYRRHVFPTPMRMSIACCCQVNVNAAVSGVLFTGDIEDPEAGRMVVAGTWGQGVRLVEGNTASDTYLLEKTPPYRVISRQIRTKHPVYLMDSDHCIVETELPVEQQQKPCLTPEQLADLGAQGVRIEHYFNLPQDIEWSIDQENNIVILQSRPLNISGTPTVDYKLDRLLSRYEILIENRGSVAQQGIASGPVFVPRSIESLEDFPDGAILVGKSDSSRFVRVMHRACAIITEVGSPVSHMSTLCREFHIPCLVNVTGILDLVSDGMALTIDTEDRKIYRGRIPELLAYQLSRPDFHKNSKETVLLRRLTRNISRLHLIDPLMEDFVPAKCITYHDLLRYIHEKAVQSLVNIGKDERTLLKNNLVRPLRLPISTGILVIDIGGGVISSAGRHGIAFDEIESIPFKSIISGMLHPEVWHQEAMSISLRDIMNSITSVPSDLVDGHYTGQNIAIITRNYVNLCFRFGYHFNIIDSYCDQNTRENHIYFRFLGGATSITKRSRRAKLIAEILTHYDFRVNLKGDLVIARIGNKHETELRQLLNILGRLIGFTRQLDVHMNSDETIQRHKNAFIEGNYQVKSI